MKNNNHKKGFSIIELSVVMAIMALLSILAIFSLLSVRKVGIVEQASEKLLSEIRETQNKAISVSTAPDGSIPEVWGIEIFRSNRAYLLKYLIVNPNTNVVTMKNTTMNMISLEGLDSVSIKAGSTTIPGSILLMYAAPFGKYYAGENTCSGQPVGTCWKENTIMPYDFSYNDATKKNEIISITLANGGYSRTIIIEKNGDSYVQ